MIVIFVALLIGYLIAAAAGGSRANSALGVEAWRWMFLVMTVPAGAYGLLTLTNPGSPRYLVRQGGLNEARRVLRKVLGNVNLDEKLAQSAKPPARTSREPGFADLRGRTLGLLPIVWVGISLSVFQQFVGINVILYYSGVVWQFVGIQREVTP